MRLKSLLNKRYTIFLVSFILIWLKTIIVYKTNFDLPVETWKQEFILLINPISTILLLLGISMFFKGKVQARFIVMISLASSIVLFANAIFYRFYSDFITIPVLFQTKNIGDLSGSFTELARPWDILFFFDTLVLLFLFKRRKLKTFTIKKREAYIFLAAAMALLAFNLALAETERPQLLTRTFDREILVKNLGTYNYHVYDFIMHSKAKAQRALADGSETSDVENYINANYQPPNVGLFGAAKNKNLIIISLESTQGFVINRTINGREITPFLNDLAKDSYYFSNFYHQTGQGKTSDSEFLLDNSLYPLPSGAVFFTHSQNEYYATPEIIKEKGYYSAAFHANNKSFWNRDIMYRSLGYDKFFSESDYEINDENAYNWGMKDIPFFEQSVEYLKMLPQPFYAKFITLSNHHPFILEEEDHMIGEVSTNDRTVNRYFQTVRYTDEALKRFFDKLIREGLYEDCVFIIYGDHYGISENHNKAMEQLMGIKMTPYVSTQLQRVPMLVHIPGHTERKDINTSVVSGQIDLMPTILHLLGIGTKNTIQFGHDLFSKERENAVFLRDGSFITEELVYAKGKCYYKPDGIEIDKEACRPVIERAKKELELSDKVVYGDLFRFFVEKDVKE
ncbi:LTA synthase family protein [Pseudalkalibacillus caeni]|uniref:LTA synthase family protein n=1 Tax=Exobacillus caeni TaxID=2574798 RepID=A0A5R9F9T1_9BACL|nr:LTA synthase family protein [Pseudalkalibacillus caeni]TLS39000.1 LTA synthase family protein [Pseudalkalibacillus caeni]